MKYVWKGIFWIGVYLFLTLAPLFVLLLGPTPGGSGFWWDFSLALGFSGTAMMGVMFVMTARFKRATAPFGIDLIYYFHRQISLVALLFILAHPVIIFAAEPQLLFILRPVFIPWPLLAGVVSLVALAVLMATSLWRKNWGIDYDSWRLWHLILAVAALGLAIVHIVGVAHYVVSPGKFLLWTAITISCVGLLLYARLVRPFWLLRHPYRVAEIRPERGDAWTLVLESDGHPGLNFQAGQFAWLSIWDSPLALREHPFSFSGSAERPGRLEFTIKELGDFTRRIRHVTLGQRVCVDGPYGAFCIDRNPTSGHVFVAAGIGIAPIMSMLRTLADRRDERPLLLVYAYHTWERLTFREELERLREKLNLRVVTVLWEAPEGWTGETGLISEELLGRHLPAERDVLECFICGPVPMIDLSERALNRLGVPLARIHSELFDLV
jgi:predicted ferric reductase